MIFAPYGLSSVAGLKYTIYMENPKSYKAILKNYNLLFFKNRHSLSFS